MTRCIIFRLPKSINCLSIETLLLIAVVLVGCKRSTTAVDSDGRKATATPDGNTTKFELKGPNGGKATMAKNGDGMEVAFKRANGEEVHFTSGKDVALPAGFPTDVAIYPNSPLKKGTGSEPVSENAAKNNDREVPVPFFQQAAKTTIASVATTGEGLLVILKSADSTEKIKSFYQEKLKADGWKIETALDTPVGTMLQGAKEKRTLNVLIATESNKRIIQITVASKKN